MNIIDTLTRIHELAKGHEWIPLAIVFISWLTSLTSDWSRAPVNIPARWQPVIAVVLGQVYGALQLVAGGMPAWQAILGAFGTGFGAMGLYDLLIKAIYGGNVPRWLAWLSFARKSDGDGGPSGNPPAKLPLPPPKGPSQLLGRAARVAHGFAVPIVVCALELVPMGTTNAGCRSGSPPDVPTLVEAGAPVANDACSFLDGVDETGASRSICATVVDLVEVAIPFILDLRKATDAGAPAREVCENLPLPEGQPPFCATSAERSKAVLAIARSRVARLSRDAGAR